VALAKLKFGIPLLLFAVALLALSAAGLAEETEHSGKADESKQSAADERVGHEHAEPSGDVKRIVVGLEAGAVGHGEHSGGHGENPLEVSELFKHVQDADYFHVPRFMDFDSTHESRSNDGSRVADGHVYIPQPFRLEQPLTRQAGIFEPMRLQLSKFMILEILAGALTLILFVWLAGRIGSGSRAKGRLANTLEAFVIFIRDDIAQPAIGSRKDTNRFLPFLLTLFFFVLGMNLLGMVPFFGAATGSIAVTGVLALITFAVVVGSGVVRFGPIGYLKNQVPHMDVPIAMSIGLTILIFPIELFGLFVKHFVLAVRLFANMLAGHLVLAVFIAFIQVTAQPDLFSGYLVYGVAPLSILASVLLGCLEVLVAFLQAYIFTFLASLFIGSSLHPH
jgi:F-type H+-transporting ATPase subunit a